MMYKVKVGYYDALIDGGDGHIVTTTLVIEEVSVGTAIEKAIKTVNDTMPKAHGNAFYLDVVYLGG